MLGPGRPRQPAYSEEDRAEVLALLRADELPIFEIARITGISQPTILRWGRESGIKRTPGWRRPIESEQHAHALELLHADQLTVERIAETVGSTPEQVLHWRRVAGIGQRGGPPLEAGKRERALELLRAGELPHTEIAVIVEASPTTVGGWAREAGLSPGRGWRRPDITADGTEGDGSAPSV